MSKEKCEQCGDTNFAIIRDMTSRRICKCGYTWPCPEKQMTNTPKIKWDEDKAMQEAFRRIKECPFVGGPKPQPMFREGARWQFEQDQKAFARLLEEAMKLKAALLGLYDMDYSEDVDREIKRFDQALKEMGEE